MSGPDGISPAGRSGTGGILDALRTGRLRGDEARLRAATDGLESTFYQELFKAMRESVPKSGLLDGGSGEASFTTMLDEHLAEVEATRTQRGLGQALYRWLTQGRESGS